MKRIILTAFAVIALLAGCEKAERSQPGTTYVFRDELGLANQLDNTLSGSDIRDKEVLIAFSEYYGSQCVATQSVTNPVKGESYFYSPNKRTEYIIVQISMSATNISTGKSAKLVRYIANAFYLEEGQTTKIVVTEDTLISTTKPIL